MLFSRKLLWPPKHGKLGGSSTLQITHSEDCTPGKSRNFAGLSNEENDPGLFFASAAFLLEPFVIKVV